MPQLQLPIFPEGTTLITPEIGFECREGKVTYVHGHLPVFQHAQEDVAAFRYFTSQLVVNGSAWLRRWACWPPHRCASRPPAMCPEAVCYWRCRRCWRWDCCATQQRCIRCRMDSTESPASFCCWR